MRYSVYHSPWPIMLAFNTGFMLLNLISNYNLIFSSMVLIFSLVNWAVDFYKEQLRGQYGKLVNLSLKYAFIMFLLTESMYFVALFWCLISNSFSPTLSNWPSSFIFCHSTFVPILGTLLLIGSSVSATASHHYYKVNKNLISNLLLIFTIISGVFFVIVTGYEFYCNKFTITDGIYGSIFYMLLGTHLVHVILGLLFLIISPTGETREIAIYYWHYVDTVWLFVFAAIYINNGLVSFNF